VQHRGGARRIRRLIRRGLKAGVWEDGVLEESEAGGPPGGSISVGLSHLSLHSGLDLWFARIVQPRLPGEASLTRYLADCGSCFQHRPDAERFQQGLGTRLAKFALALEPNKPRLVAFGRFAESQARERGKRPETLPLLGLTPYCTRNHHGHCKGGWKTDKTRLRRSRAKIHQPLQRLRHEPLTAQGAQLTQALRGHYAYYGVAGNMRSLPRLYANVERYWRTMLSSRSRQGNIRWDVFQQRKRVYPLQRPKLFLPYTRIKSYAVL
jgi:RNA-directed DNA polymerase